MRYVNETKGWNLYENGAFVGWVKTKKLADEFKRGEADKTLFSEEKNDPENGCQ